MKALDRSIRDSSAVVWIKKLLWDLSWDVGYDNDGDKLTEILSFLIY